MGKWKKKSKIIKLKSLHFARKYPNTLWLCYYISLISCRKGHASSLTHIISHFHYSYLNLFFEEIRYSAFWIYVMYDKIKIMWNFYVCKGKISQVTWDFTLVPLIFTANVTWTEILQERISHTHLSVKLQLQWLHSQNVSQQKMQNWHTTKKICHSCSLYSIATESLA